MQQHALFSVKSVAIVGVSEEDGRIGSGLYKSIRQSFPGEIYCVNPRYDTIWDRPCYPTVLSLPETPSHAVIAVARRRVPECLRQCADKGIKNVVVISSGFKETDAEGAEMEREMARLCRERGITLLGPNTLGFINTAIPYNGTFLPEEYLSGTVSVISQSGGVGMALLSALHDQGCGIAKWAGIGNEAVIDAVALLAYYAADPATRAIGVCFEGLRDLPGFLRLAREVNREKPVVVLRDGKGSVGRKAAASHTGTMAQSDALMSALLRQHGLLEAKSCRECAAMLKALSLAAPPAGERLTILTNTAGPAILASDELEGAGVALPMPTAALTKTLDEAVGVAMGLKNPADISSNGLSPRNYGIACRTLLGSEEYDILLGFFSLSSHLLLPDQEMTAAVKAAGKPAVACFLGREERFSRYDRLPEKDGIPCYCDPSDAAAAVKALVHWGRARRAVYAAAAPVMSEAQRAAVSDYLSQWPDGTLSEQEAKEVLSLAGAAVDSAVIAATAEEAVAAARRCGYPVALKLHSHKITHKSDVGGVRLNIPDEAALRTAFDEMLSAMRALDSEALLTVQRMHGAGFELILGGVNTPGSGAVVMAGMGGVYAEVLGDMTFCAAPLGEGEAERMLTSLRCAPIIDGWRGEALDKGAAARELQRLGELMTLCPRLREIDLNPCRLYREGIAVLDARMVLATK